MKTNKKLLISSIISILFLILISTHIKPETLPAKLTNKNQNQKIQIISIIKNIKTHNNNIIIQLNNTDIPLKIYNTKTNLIFQLKKNQKIKAIARIHFYKTNPELIADKITILAD